MTRSVVVAQGDEGAAPALAWLRDALWVADADVELLSVEAGDDRATWLSRPAVGSPELLVPLASARAAAGVSRRFWDGMPAGRRTRQWLGEAALRTGMAQRFWPGRVALLGADADCDDPNRSLLARLAVLLDHPRLLAAVTLRPTHYNAKPILQLFSERGTPVAFAKVAVDDVSAGYVGTEIQWLRRAEAAPLPLEAPRLIATPEWQGRPVAVLEPLALPRVPRRPSGWAREEVAAAVIALGPVEQRRVVEAAPVQRALAEAEGDGNEEVKALVDAVLARHGDRSIDLGVWHGDLSPWNQASRRDRVLVWDWELAGDGMPLGADLRHEEVMVATHLGGQSAAHVLAALDPADPAVALYLLELVRRDLHAARAGRVDGYHGLGEAAGRRLWAELGR